jgi:hypothetical protein
MEVVAAELSFEGEWDHSESSLWEEILTKDRQEKRDTRNLGWGVMSWCDGGWRESR